MDTYQVLKSERAPKGPMGMKVLYNFPLSKEQVIRLLKSHKDTYTLVANVVEMDPDPIRGFSCYFPDGRVVYYCAVPAGYQVTAGAATRHVQDAIASIQAQAQEDIEEEEGGNYGNI